jgi:MoaA/NifB/PqqE/SkfB family radical SAM enzyme
MSGKADIKLGYTCNNHCIHCVIADQRDRARALRGNVDRSTAEFLRELADAKARDLSDVVFTGGEPTIRKDLPALLAQAAALGFRLHVQTNGRRLAYRPFAEKVAPFGATWVVALHGPTADIHDRVTEVAGSFDQTFVGIANLRELQQRVVGKVVLSKVNYAALPELIETFLRLEVRLVNVAFPHALGHARERFAEVVPRYTDVLPHVRRAIDRHGRHALLYFEAIPLCLMRGYEKHVAEYACGALKRPAVHKQLDMETRDWQEARREQKAKFEQCARCTWDELCEGPWREYPEHFGSEEFVPVVR